MNFAKALGEGNNKCVKNVSLCYRLVALGYNSYSNAFASLAVVA
jgi:hypothetical protein